MIKYLSKHCCAKVKYRNLGKARFSQQVNESQNEQIETNLQVIDVRESAELDNIDLKNVKSLADLSQDQKKLILKEQLKLNLPQTEFNQRRTRKDLYDKYENMLTWELYNWQYYGRQGARANWIIHDGPPFASGKAHLGNFYNKVLKDIINRYKLLQGYRVHFIPGFDCYGTHIEALALNVNQSKVDNLDLSLDKTTSKQQGDKYKGISEKDKQILKKRSICRDFVKDSVLTQMQEYSKWGIMTDWRYSYLTMMPSYESMILEKFAQLARNNQIERGSRAVFWSIQKQQIIDETEMQEVKELRDCVISKFPIKTFGSQSQKIQELYPNAQLLVFTQIPWHLTGTHAVAINEKLTYALCKFQDEYLIVAERRIGELEVRTGEKLKTLFIMNGTMLSDLILQHPLFPDRHIPVHIFNDITPSFGTGINSVSPGHDITSLRIALQYGLPKQGFVDKNGNLIKEELGDQYAGMNVKDEKTGKAIIKLLEDQSKHFLNFQFQTIKYQHVKTEEEIIMRTTDGWYMRISERLQMKCLQELSTIKYVPKLNLKTSQEVQEDEQKLKRSKKKKEKLEEIDGYYLNIVEEINDFNEWCISEDSNWGIPIPFFINKDTQEVLFNGEIADYVAKIFIERGGSDAWYSLSVQELLPRKYKEEHEKYEKGYQVFDVWFDNSFTWNFILNENDFHSNNPLTVDIQNSLKQLHGSSYEEQNRQIQYEQSEMSTEKIVKPSLKDYMKKKKQQKNIQPKTQISLPNYDEIAVAKHFPTNILDSIEPKSFINQASKMNKINNQTLNQNLFPSNMYLEGYDQHSRWFMTSMLTSVALTGQSSFKCLKTHGIFLDENGDKMTKSNSNLTLQPEDFIEGSMKLTGERKYGYGLDVIRSWAAFKDTDKNMIISKEQFENINKEVKLMREIFRSLLGYLHDLDVNKSKFDFNKLTIVDKMMYLRIMEFSKELTQTYDNFDLKQVYQLVRDFCVQDVSNFYLEFVKMRLVAMKGTAEYHSSIQLILKLLEVLMKSVAPIACYSAQEVFDFMPKELFENYEKPITVFQQKWFLKDIEQECDNEFLSKFSLRDYYKHLSQMRTKLMDTFESEILQMVSKRNILQCEIAFVVQSLDSKEATLFEILENDLSDFFFGCQVTIETTEQNNQRKQLNPLKTIYHKFTIESQDHDKLSLDTPKDENTYQYKIRVYRSKMIKCERCLKHKIKGVDKNESVSEKVCQDCREIIKAYN